MLCSTCVLEKYKPSFFTFELLITEKERKRMKIYFCGSIRGGRQDADIYMKIIDQLKSYGEVLTEHVGYISIDETVKMNDKEIHDRDCDWLHQSDAVVAEVTQTSLGVGYEIGRAVAWNKKILCLYRPSPEKSLSAMIRGAHNGKTIIVKDYAVEEVPQILKEFFDS